MAEQDFATFDMDFSDFERPPESRLVGHRGSIDQVNQMIKGQCIPHGMIFQGPWGIGKSTFAFHMAYGLLKNVPEFCTHLESHDPLFRQIFSQSHPDYFYLDGAQGSVEDVREVLQFFQQTAAMGGWRVAILDNVHLLSVRAATSILKLLEEPPEKCVLILITPHLDRLPMTLRSRCQILNFSPLSPLEGSKVLMEGDPTFSLDEANQLMEHSQGSPGYGLALKTFGGATFIKQFNESFNQIETQGLGPILSLLDPILFKNKETDLDQAWQLMVEFLQDFSHRWLKEKVLEDVSYGPLAQVWFENGSLFQMGEIFHLDRRQMLIVSLTQLTMYESTR